MSARIYYTTTPCHTKQNWRKNEVTIPNPFESNRLATDARSYLDILPKMVLSKGNAPFSSLYQTGCSTYIELTEFKNGVPSRSRTLIYGVEIHCTIHYANGTNLG